MRLMQTSRRYPRNSLILMPTYEYSCEKCGQNFDAFQSMRDEPFENARKSFAACQSGDTGK